MNVFSRYLAVYPLSCTDLHPQTPFPLPPLGKGGNPLTLPELPYLTWWISSHGLNICWLVSGTWLSWYQPWCVFQDMMLVADPGSPGSFGVKHRAAEEMPLNWATLHWETWCDWSSWHEVWMCDSEHVDTTEWEDVCIKDTCIITHCLPWCCITLSIKSRA